MTQIQSPSSSCFNHKMKLKAFLPFNSKLCCSKPFSIFPLNSRSRTFSLKPSCLRRPRFRRSFSVRAKLRLRRRLRRRHPPPAKPSNDRFGEKVAELLLSKELEQVMEQVMEQKSVANAGKVQSPVGGGYRSFERLVAEMVVEEGKLKDLMDVEELLFCWRNLKNPVFVDLVCMFYGELCKDLLSEEDDECS